MKQYQIHWNYWKMLLEIQVLALQHLWPTKSENFDLQTKLRRLLNTPTDPRH